MAVSVVSGKTGSYTGGGLSATWSDLGPGAGVAAGQVIVVAVVTEGVHTLNGVPAGWTQLGSTINPDTNPGGLSVLAKRAGASETGLVTFEFTASVRVTSAWCVLDGVDDITMLDVAVQTGTTGFGTAKDLGITTATANAGLLMVNGSDPSSTISMTWDSGITDVVQANTSGNGHIDIGFRLQPTAGATSMGGTWDTGRGGAHMLIAFKAGDSVPPGDDPGPVTNLSLSDPGDGTLSVSFDMPSEATTSRYMIRMKNGLAQTFSSESDGTLLLSDDATPSESINVFPSGFDTETSYTIGVWSGDDSVWYGPPVVDDITTDPPPPLVENIDLIEALSGTNTVGGLSDTWTGIGPGPGALINDVILIGIVTETPHDLIVPDGWTLVTPTVTSQTNPASLSVIARRAGVSEPGLVDIQFQSIERAVFAWSVYRGVDLVTMINGVIQSGISGYGTRKELSMTTVTDGAAVIGFFGADPQSSLNMTWDVGITEVAEGLVSGSGFISVGLKIPATSGVVSMGGDLDTGRGGAMIVMGLTPRANPGVTVDPSPASSISLSDEGGGDIGLSFQMPSEESAIYYRVCVKTGLGRVFSGPDDETQIVQSAAQPSENVSITIPGYSPGSSYTFGVWIGSGSDNWFGPTVDDITLSGTPPAPSGSTPFRSMLGVGT